MLTLSAVTNEEGHPLENEDESGRRLCEYWGTMFQARVEGPRHHQYEDILRFIQKTLDDIRWANDRTEFDELIAMKKDSAPGLLVPTGVLEVWARNSFLMLAGLCWKEVPFNL